MEIFKFKRILSLLEFLLHQKTKSIFFFWVFSLNELSLTLVAWASLLLTLDAPISRIPFLLSGPWMMNKLKNVYLILQSFSFIYHIRFSFILFFKRAIFNPIPFVSPSKAMLIKGNYSLSFIYSLLLLVIEKKVKN